MPCVNRVAYPAKLLRHRLRHRHFLCFARVFLVNSLSLVNEPLPKKLIKNAFVVDKILRVLSNLTAMMTTTTISPVFSAANDRKRETANRNVDVTIFLPRRCDIIDKTNYNNNII